MIYIGIDPGASGAIVLVDLDPVTNSMSLVEVHDMPVIHHRTSEGKRRSRVDPIEVHGILSRVPAIAGICIEHVGPRPTDSTVSAFGFGYAFAVVESIARLVAPHVVELIRPQAWKSAFDLTSDKAEALLVARHLFPDVTHLAASRTTGAQKQHCSPCTGPSAATSSA